MTTIDPDQNVVTLVNVFTVDPDRQAALVDALITATESVMRDVPGFVSANIHRSLDGERVVNYAQWESVEAFEAMRQDPSAAEHIEAIGADVDFDAHLYEVVSTHEATD
ncbi:MAG: antibiotic biosynthesis monooxygenase [Haloarculaceae archaeon]